MPPINYGFEKLFSACHDAIGTTGTPQERLASAVSYNLSHLERENLPSDEAWENLQELITAATCKPAKGDEGTIAATTSQMSDDEASEWLRKMLNIFSDVAEEYGRLEGAEEV
jgi:hypothetical protein